MAGSLNKACIIGHLGQDPEVRNLPSGGKVVNISVATSESWKDKQSGERREQTEWHRVVIFNENLAKVAESYLRKGSKVYLEGQIKTRKWKDQSNVEKYSTEIVLQGFNSVLTLLDSKAEGESRGGGSSGGDDRSGSTGRSRPRESSGFDSGGMDDDIPFNYQPFRSEWE